MIIELCFLFLFSLYNVLYLYVFRNLVNDNEIINYKCFFLTTFAYTLYTYINYDMLQ